MKAHYSYPLLDVHFCVTLEHSGVPNSEDEGGKMREKGWEERGPKAHSKNSDFGTPMI